MSEHQPEARPPFDPETHVGWAADEKQPEAPAVPGVARWRKKAVVVEAMQLTHESGPRIWEWADSKPTYGTDNFVDGLAIYTLEGRMRANFGDWIIKGVKGEFYPCREDIFAATYEPAGETPAASPAPLAAALDLVALGQLVHETRLAENAKLDRPFNLEPWDRRSPSQQALDMKIAEAVAAAVLGSDGKGAGRG